MELILIVVVLVLLVWRRRRILGSQHEAIGERALRSKLIKLSRDCRKQLRCKKSEKSGTSGFA